MTKIRVNDLVSFIEGARVVHGHRYSYSKFRYTKSIEKSVITCEKHGDFTQSPNKHLSGRGCPDCAKEERMLPFDDAYKRMKASIPHYEIVGEYCNASTRCEFVCQKHGSHFFASPRGVIAGKHSCKECDHENRVSSCGSNVTITNDEYVRRAKDGSDYDYSECDFTGWHEKVTIICPSHGRFYPSAASHLYSSVGCPKCSMSRSTKQRTFTTSKFIDMGDSIHDGKYDYSLVDYTGIFDKVSIICKEHGEFRQVPNSHLRGKGCPECGRLAGGGKYKYPDYMNETEARRSSFLYYVRFFREDGSSFDKVGVTCKTISERFASSPIDYIVIDFIETTLYEACINEKRLLDHLRSIGEAYKVNDFRGTSVGGWTECFRRGLLEDAFFELSPRSQSPLSRNVLSVLIDKRDIPINTIIKD